MEEKKSKKKKKKSKEDNNVELNTERTVDDFSKYNVEINDTIVPAPLDLETLSEEKVAKLKLFKEKVAEYIRKGCQDQDFDFCRFLIARKWDVDKSAEMYINMIKWREENKIDETLERVPKESRWFKMLDEYWPITCIPSKNAGFRTHDGYQIHYERIVALAPDLLNVIPYEDVQKFHLFQCECLRVERERIIKEKGKYSGAIFVEDLTGLSFGHLVGANMNFISKLTETESLYYPEALRKVYMINCPTLFFTAWKVIKKVLDEGTLEKIEILGTNYYDVLTTVIPPEFIPKCYGGEMDYFPSGGGSLKQYIKDLPKPMKITVAAADKFVKKFTLNKDSVIGWDFVSVSYDIAFGVVLKEGDTTEEIIKIERVDSHKNKISGCHTVTKDGEYELHWDNTFSYTRGKVLKYTIFVDGVTIKD